MRRNHQAGFSITELMIIVGIISIVLYGVTQVSVSLMRNTSVADSRASRVALGDAIRLQLSQKAVCLNSFQKLPGSWTSPDPQEVSVNLNASATGPAADSTQLIEKDRELKTFNNLIVRSFQVVDIKLLGKTTTKAFYSAGLQLSVDSKQLSSTSAEDRFKMSAQRIASVVFEVPVAGGAPTGCYSTNPDLDISMVVDTLCTIEGGTMVDGKCTAATDKGEACKFSKINPPKPDSCSLKLSKAVTPADVPASDSAQYMWVCKGTLGGVPTWIPKDTMVGPGIVISNDCMAETRNLTNAEIASGSIPSGTVCNYTSQNGDTTCSGSSTCVSGVIVGGQTTCSAPNPNVMGN